MKAKKVKAKRASGASSGRIVPLSDRVLIREIEKSEESRSGIIIPETVSDDRGAKRGTVIAVGEGKYEDGKLVPIRVKVGQTVLFQWGEKIKIDDVEYSLVRESEIAAVIK
ncbi:MAG: chaperonin GroES [Parcubacteria group bacterium Gr01-1014_72]|nr:MAG: chaperonin GroES [Parcubacteria group bacterium Gr01-1014_72]